MHCLNKKEKKLKKKEENRWILEFYLAYDSNKGRREKISIDPTITISRHPCEEKGQGMLFYIVYQIYPRFLQVHTQHVWFFFFVG